MFSKKTLAALCIVLLVLCCTVLAQAEYSGVVSRLNRLRTIFPHGRYWDHPIDESLVGYKAYLEGDETWLDAVTDTPCNHNPYKIGNHDCNFFDGAIQCYGFANRIFFEVFGRRCSSENPRYDMENVLPGDHVRSVGWGESGHSAIVLARDGDVLTLAECNYSGPCMITWGRQANISEFYSFKRASNWEEINNSVVIDEVSFPDHNFRQMIKADYDRDGDNVLNQAELEAIIDMNCSRGDIVSLKGIEYFPALRTLECESNALTELDVSGCKTLQRLNCYGNRLTELNISGCSSLVYLDCASNPGLKSLTIGKQDNLNTLYCQQCSLTSLDISGAASLEEMWCNHNKLKTLELSENLKTVYCHGNRISSLNVTNCARLKDLVRNTARETDTPETDVFNGEGLLYIDRTVTVKAGSFVSKPTAVDVTDKNGLYRIADGTAALIGLKKLTLSSLTIQNTILYNGKKFKVTAVRADACKGSGLTEITIGSNVKTIEDRAFYGCAFLRQVSGGKGLTRIDKSAFEKCKSLTEFSIGDKVTKIGNRAFFGCSKLKKVTGGSALLTIGAEAFRNCKSLTAFVIPLKVKNIGKQAFFNCSGLKTVTIQSLKLTDKSVGDEAFAKNHPEAIYKCPRLKYKAYRKLLVQKGVPDGKQIRKTEAPEGGS